MGLDIPKNKPVENPASKGSVGVPVAEISKEIDDKLRQIIFSGQIVGLTYEQIGHQVGLSRQSVSNRVNKILESIPQEKINKTYMEFSLLFDRLFRDANKLLTKHDGPKGTILHDRKKAEAIELTMKIIKEKTELMERFHIKPKAIDNLAISAKVEHAVTPDFLHKLSKLK